MHKQANALVLTPALTLYKYYPMHTPDKEVFLATEFTQLLLHAPVDTAPAWGKLNLQQMVEHFTEAVNIASGKIKIDKVLTPPENIEKMQAFLASDKPFKQNTPNPLMPEVPAPVVHSEYKTAVKTLQEALDYFFEVFRNGLQQTSNPFFGHLNYEQNVQLLYKHAVHHLKQFGLFVAA